MGPLRLRATTALLALGCGAVVAFIPSPPLRVAAGMALVLVLPGLVVAGAVLRGRETWPERMLVTLGGSVGIVALVALFLDAFHVALTRTTWAAVLALLVAGGSIVSSRRRPCGAERRVWPAVRWMDAALVAAAAAALAAALAIGTKPLRPPAATPGYAAVWIEPKAARHAVAVVESGELHPATFRLAVAVEGRIVASEPHVTVAPGEQYRLPVPTSLRPGSRVTALLERLGDPAHARQRAELTFGETAWSAPAELPS
jgi:hypothetical protein